MDIPSFWHEYMETAEKFYRLGHLAPSTDPMLAAMCDCFRKIDAALTKAVVERCTLFDCRLLSHDTRIAIRFRSEDGRQFQRTFGFDASVTRQGRPLTKSDIVDIKVYMQSVFLGDSRIQPDPKARWMIPIRR